MKAGATRLLFFYPLNYIFFLPIFHKTEIHAKL